MMIKLILKQSAQIVFKGFLGFTFLFHHVADYRALKHS